MIWLKSSFQKQYWIRWQSRLLNDIGGQDQEGACQIMRLRTAIKVQKYIENGWMSKRQGKGPIWRRETILKSRDICRRKWRHKRVPYVRSDEELNESFGFMMSILADVIIEDESERDEFKNKLWTELER